MNNVNIEEIVKQVLSGMTGNAPAQTAAPAAQTPAAPAIPKTARVAMMTEKKHFELQEYPLPEVGDDDILVKVEGWAFASCFNASQSVSMSYPRSPLI